MARRLAQIMQVAVAAPEVFVLKHESAQSAHIQIIHPTLSVVLNVPSQSFMGQTAQRLTCSIMEKLHTGSYE